MTKCRYRIEHVSSFRYKDLAQSSLMLLRLRPRDDDSQRVQKFSLRIDPFAATTQFEDPFGNRCHLFNVHRLHRSTEVHTRVQVESAGDRQLPERLGAGAWEALTAAVDSPMDHILETGQGVCQDYTHVMLAIGRSWGIPSRYVSGYIHREGAAGEQSLAGASHAWGEFFLPDLGWVGIDPTNDTVADHRFIAVAVGRDYADASPTRGTVLGGGESTLDVKVTVVSEDETAPDWSPHREWPNLRTVAPTPREYSHRSDQ